MTKKKKKVLIIVGAILTIFICTNIVVAGLLGGMGPLKFLRDKRILKLPGNAEQYDLKQLEVMPDSPLAGGHIIALGSSVTYGSASAQQAVGEYLAARYGTVLTKEALSGTTLANLKSSSYVARMEKNLSVEQQCDLFVCQLSTNDASQDIELGAISESKNKNEFDTKTVIGAIEYIICDAQETWGCPVVFYTGSYYENERYAKMVEQLLLLREKYEALCVIDLYTDVDFNHLSDKERKLYMNDDIHPTRAGYLLWWGPEIERQLNEYLKQHR